VSFSFLIKVRLEATTVQDILTKTNLIRTEESYNQDVARIGKERTKRLLDGSTIKLPPLTHGILENSIWNKLPFFHVMRPGMLIPCMAHDVLAGLGRTELSLIMIDLSKSHNIEWRFLQANLKILQQNLSYEDKRDFSSKLTGISIIYN